MWMLNGYFISDKKKAYLKTSNLEFMRGPSYNCKNNHTHQTLFWAVHRLTEYMSSEHSGPVCPSERRQEE